MVYQFGSNIQQAMTKRIKVDYENKQRQLKNGKAIKRILKSGNDVVAAAHGYCWRFLFNSVSLHHTHGGWKAAWTQL